MSMSNIQALAFALRPGAAEYLEKYAISAGNIAWDGMVKGVKYARNALYVSVALTIIAGIGATLSTRQYACATVATMGAVLAIVAAKRLYNTTLFLQRAINAGLRP